MTTVQENNRRIAKNTIFLYVRMAIIIIVTLYTSRVILNALGVSDYGVYNVMGGVIGMLGYVNTLLAGGTSRFLTIELGKGDINKLIKTFSTTQTLCIISAGIIIFLGETIGLWFVNTHLNIDPGRMNAANWVYQCALLSSALTIIQTPFTASIISHEKMSIYAYMSIFDALIKLSIAFALTIYNHDKLKLYALLMLVANIVNIVIYRIYCIKNFKECTISLSIDKTIFPKLFSYSSWNTIGALAGVLINYGTNILLNIFFGTIINAARGIAQQVNSVIQQFYSNFQLASRPQIMKYYAQNDLQNMFNLIRNNSKYSAFLLICFIIPIGVNIDGILLLWLGQIPEYTAIFVKLALIQTLLSAIDAPIGMGLHSVGRMKLPNLSSACLNILAFPLTYIAFKAGGSPTWGYIIMIIILPLVLIIDLSILKHYTGFNIKIFIIKVIIPILFAILLGITLSLLIKYLLPENHIWYITLINCTLSFIMTAIAIFFIWIPRNLKKIILNKVFNK